MFLKVPTLEEFKLQIDFSTSALLVFGKRAPEKSPRENCSPENYHQEIYPRGKITSRKNSPQENCPRTIDPWKTVLLDFCCF